MSDDAEDPKVGPDDSDGTGRLGRSIRRAAAAVFSGSEESMRVPKEALTSLLQTGERGRKELVRLVSKEVSTFLKGVDMAGVIRQALTGMRLDIEASIRFVSDDEVETSFKSKTKNEEEEAKSDRNADATEQSETSVPETDP